LTYSLCLERNPEACDSAFLMIIVGGDVQNPVGPAISHFEDRTPKPPFRGPFQLLPGTMINGSDIYMSIFADWFPGGQKCINYLHYCFDDGFPTYVDGIKKTFASCQTERKSPYDVAGGTFSTSNSIDTTALTNGPHTLSYVIRFKGSCFPGANGRSPDPGFIFRQSIPFIVDNFY